MVDEIRSILSHFTYHLNLIIFRVVWLFTSEHHHHQNQPSSSSKNNQKNDLPPTYEEKKGEYDETKSPKKKKEVGRMNDQDDKIVRPMLRKLRF